MAVPTDEFASPTICREKFLMQWTTCTFVVAWLVTSVAGAHAAATISRSVIRDQPASESLLEPDAWEPWHDGFDREGDLLVCDNGTDRSARRGAGQTVQLNQDRPRPIVASVSSRSVGVTGTSDNNYSVYLDLTFVDGTQLWGQAAPFSTGTHGWQRRQVTVLPEKPVARVSFYMLLRGHSGIAWFRDPVLRQLEAPDSAHFFEGVPVILREPPREGFLVRDVGANSDFVRIDHEALGLRIQTETSHAQDATFFDVTLTDRTGRDRAITLLYALPVRADGLEWLESPRRRIAVQPGREYSWTSRFRVGANGRLSRYPLGAVAHDDGGVGLGIDMSRPAWFRVAYHAGTHELYLAYDVGLTPERPAARLRFCRFGFEPQWGFRAALARYYRLFPDHFRCRTRHQGLWMPFAKISEVEDWEDFGFRFKEGTNETAWDDDHRILTFRYTEPMTWWMRMPKEMPRTLDAAMAEVRNRAARGDERARALLTSGFHDARGGFAARLLNTPWCDGAVWSINSMPGISGDVTDFGLKWNTKLRSRFYGPDRSGDLDGEYIDSSEGYVTDELDFRRDHFAVADTPLTFSLDQRRPAIFRGLAVFEFVRAMAHDVHGMGKLMMANSTPNRFCWLAPLLEVMGSETDWNPDGHWRPMSDQELLYRRAMCKGKPYCFLMNTRFEQLSHRLVEKYMQRCLAYGMFPGFFSHNASQGHYFTRPQLYNRDRALFKKYVPLCRQVAEAGWNPVTGARSSHPHVFVERFGQRYLTVLNDSDRTQPFTITMIDESPAASRELVSNQPITWREGQTTLSLDAECVAVIDLRPELKK